MTDNVIKAPARPAWAAELNDQEMLFVSAYRRLPAPTEQPMTIDVTPGPASLAERPFGDPHQEREQ
jgi:hypothetical protein